MLLENIATLRHPHYMSHMTRVLPTSLLHSILENPPLNAIQCVHRKVQVDISRLCRISLVSYLFSRSKRFLSWLVCSLMDLAHFFYCLSSKTPSLPFFFQQPFFHLNFPSMHHSKRILIQLLS